MEYYTTLKFGCRRSPVTSYTFGVDLVVDRARFTLVDTLEKCIKENGMELEALLLP